jgi:hypothetical protein
VPERRSRVPRIFPETYVLEFDDESAARRAAASYEQDPDVAYSSRTFVHEASFVPNRPLISLRTGSWGQP